MTLIHNDGTSLKESTTPTPRTASKTLFFLHCRLTLLIHSVRKKLKSNFRQILNVTKQNVRFYFDMSYLHCQWTVAVIYWLTEEAVIHRPG